MGKILFYLVIKPISFLPHFLLYRLSDLIFLIIYYIVRYRKEVIFSNLKNAFPEKNENEINTIAKGFYQHFCDIIVESIKSFHISEKELMRRCKIRNPELLQKYYDLGKSIIVPAGHFNNWEMAATASHLQIAHQSVGAYRPMKDPFMNQLIADSRKKFGLALVPIKELKAFFRNYKGEPFAMLFGCDQSPHNLKLAYWTNFLNQDTGFMMGTETYAKQYDCPVIFGRVDKIKRGFYEFEFILVEDKPLQTEKGEITEKYIRILEEIIFENPQYWLWSHKRWKQKRPLQPVLSKADLRS